MQFRGSAALAVLVLGLAGAIAAFSVGYSWTEDNLRLERIARQVVAGAATEPEIVTRLTDWVYRNRGFAKNHQSFLIAQLGPTPVQVLASGGDCSDKSRLLSAMLRELGIRSGLVMLYPCLDCEPIHTVVEAETAQGRMIADPIWDVDYDGGVGELRNSRRPLERVTYLKDLRGAADKTQQMPPEEWNFDYARAINWQKDGVTRLAATTLDTVGFDHNRLLRPHFMEDPKFFVFILLLGPSAPLILMGSLGLRNARSPLRPSRMALRNLGL